MNDVPRIQSAPVPRPPRAPLALALFLGAALLAAQSPTAKPPLPAAPGSSAAPAAAAATAVPKAPSALPRGWEGIELGMTRDQVVAKLTTNSYLVFRGDEDLSLLPSPNQSLIEVSGLDFVRRAFFQFDAGKLWVIILNLADDRVDHFSVYSRLAANYGEPTRLDPQAAVWEDSSVRLALERPLTLRYLDLATFSRLKDAGSAKTSVEEIDRRDFLGTL